jgi:hypothetical protein
MSVAVWPTDLPRPMRDGYRSQWDDPRLRKKAEGGPPGYRRRWSSQARTVRLTIDVSRAQKAVFDQFFEQLVSQGALPFRMPDPTTDGWPMLAGDGTPMLDGTGNPLLLSAIWLCLFGDTTPVDTIKSVRFRVVFTVSVLP